MKGGCIIIGTFFYNIKRTVYKWWCVVYKPVYKLTHHGYWPQEKEPYYIPPQKPGDTPQASENVSEASVPAAEFNTASPADNLSDRLSSDSLQDNTADSGRQDDSLIRANEVLRRLEAEAAMDEAKKQAEIRDARKKAEENERLASILKSTRVDITGYINQGIANREKEEKHLENDMTGNTVPDGSAASDNDVMKKAQEIIDRLNREAAEDEAKKQAEIDEAREYARNKYDGGINNESFE